jgi:hypothetical protein
MAYNFVRANSQFISGNGPSIDVYPVTFSAWAYATNDTVAMTIMAWMQAATSQGFRTLFAGQATNDPVRGNLQTALNYISQVLPGFTINTWHHICFVCASSTSRTVYRDGNAGNTNIANATPTSLTRLLIGSNAVEIFDGHISDVAVWSTSLNTDEINSLAKGFSAKRIRPQSLEYYAPLVRNLYEYNTNTALTNNNTATVTNHNRIYV